MDSKFKCLFVLLGNKDKFVYNLYDLTLKMM